MYIAERKHVELLCGPALFEDINLQYIQLLDQEPHDKDSILQKILKYSISIHYIL